MVWIISAILSIIIIILILQQNKRKVIDKSEYEVYHIQIKQLQSQKDELNSQIHSNLSLLNEYQEKILAVQEKYKQELNKRTEDLNQYFENQKVMRQSEMDMNFDKLLREKEQNLKSKYYQLEQNELEKEDKIKQETQEVINAALKSQEDILAETQAQQERFESLLLPLRQYEMEQQERLFYTIQVPNEYKDDINFLITTVSQKVQHPDIINKLVWAEYVKPYIDSTFKRVGIEDKSGIYKITNIDSGKCYIGKSTNVKKRITDHFKSSIGIRTIADQAVHHEIWKTGFWNWTIEVIAYCDKEQLNELEKYYIKFFKSQEYGFNKTGGGEG